MDELKKDREGRPLRRVLLCRLKWDCKKKTKEEKGGLIRIEKKKVMQKKRTERF